MKFNPFPVPIKKKKFYTVRPKFYFCLKGNTICESHVMHKRMKPT